MAIGILFQIAIGIIYQRLINDADTMTGVDSKLLKRCKERFVNCYKLNGGVANISVFVDKYINRIRIWGMSINFLKHLSGQLMLAGVFMAGVGACKGIIEGRRFTELLPFYIICLFGIYLYISVVSMVDITNRKNVLKVNLMDYLENTVAKRLEQGMVEKEKLDIIEQDDKINIEENQNIISPDEARELEELLKTIIGNKA
jgi:hypothetical protein